MPKKHVTVEDIEEDEVKGKFLELNELRTFLRITEQGLYLDYLCFATLAYTGMRLGEMLALKWTDLDLTKKTIRITSTYYKYHLLHNPWMPDVFSKNEILILIY
ncbi:tyrosine-type recombinase/integrase [Peribacillus sp. NPDC058076]